MMTLNDWLKISAQKLKPLSTTFKLDSEMLLLHVLKKNKTYLYAHYDESLSESARELLDDLLKKRLNGIPMAYIIGEKEFWSLSFKVSSDVLIPRPETEHLVEITLMLLGNSSHPSCRILEMGTGSGAVAIALATEQPQWHILATDFSPAALLIAQDNAVRHHTHITFCLSNWFDAIPTQKFSAIISNPPYISEHDPHLNALQYEPISALTSGPDGLDDIRKIITQSPEYLEKGGYLLLEHGNTQAEAIREIFQASCFTTITTYTDLANHDRVTVGKIS